MAVVSGRLLHCPVPMYEMTKEELQFQCGYLEKRLQVKEEQINAINEHCDYILELYYDMEARLVQKSQELQLCLERLRAAEGRWGAAEGRWRAEQDAAVGRSGEGPERPVEGPGRSGEGPGRPAEGPGRSGEGPGCPVIEGVDRDRQPGKRPGTAPGLPPASPGGRGPAAAPQVPLVPTRPGTAPGDRTRRRTPRIRPASATSVSLDQGVGQRRLSLEILNGSGIRDLSGDHHPESGGVQQDIIALSQQTTPERKRVNGYSEHMQREDIHGAPIHQRDHVANAETDGQYLDVNHASPSTQAQLHSDGGQPDKGHQDGLSLTSAPQKHSSAGDSAIINTQSGMTPRSGESGPNSTSAQRPVTPESATTQPVIWGKDLATSPGGTGSRKVKAPDILSKNMLPVLHRRQPRKAASMPAHSMPEEESTSGGVDAGGGGGESPRPLPQRSTSLGTVVVPCPPGPRAAASITVDARDPSSDHPGAQSSSAAFYDSLEPGVGAPTPAPTPYEGYGGSAGQGSQHLLTAACPPAEPHPDRPFVLTHNDSDNNNPQADRLIIRPFGENQIVAEMRNAPPLYICSEVPASAGQDNDEDDIILKKTEADGMFAGGTNNNSLIPSKPPRGRHSTTSLPPPAMTVLTFPPPRHPRSQSPRRTQSAKSMDSSNLIDYLRSTMRSRADYPPSPRASRAPSPDVAPRIARDIIETLVADIMERVVRN